MRPVPWRSPENKPGYLLSLTNIPKEEYMAEAVQWRDDWSQALEEAKKEGRPVALEFYMDG